MKEVTELRGKFPHELTKEELKKNFYLHSDNLKEGFINETLVWYRNSSYNKEILYEDKRERENIIREVKCKGNAFQKDVIHKIKSGIIEDWYQLALIL